MQKKNIIIAGIVSIAALAATAFLVIKKRSLLKDGEPPANAPQLAIQNPGDQSDFPAAPTGDKHIG